MPYQSDYLNTWNNKKKVTFYNYNSKSVIENSFQFFFFYLEVILSNGVYLTAWGCVTDSVEKFVRTLNERNSYYSMSMSPTLHYYCVLKRGKGLKNITWYMLSFTFIGFNFTSFKQMKKYYIAWSRFLTWGQNYFFFPSFSSTGEVVAGAALQIELRPTLSRGRLSTSCLFVCTSE